MQRHLPRSRATSRARVRRAAVRRQLARRGDADGRPGGAADLRRPLRALAGPGRRARLRRARSSTSGDVVVCDTGGTSFDVSLIRDGDVVTHPRDLARRAVRRPPHRPRLGRRALDRRRRRLDRLGRLGRPAARRARERGRRPRARLLRPRRRPSRPSPTRPRARLPRPGELPRRRDAARPRRRPSRDRRPPTRSGSSREATARRGDHGRQRAHGRRDRASSRSTRASTRATRRSSPAAAPPG